MTNSSKEAFLFTAVLSPYKMYPSLCSDSVMAGRARVSLSGCARLNGTKRPPMEELSFFRSLSPWRCRGGVALCLHESGLLKEGI